MEFMVRQLMTQNDRLVRYIGDFLCFLKKDYPNFLGWYKTKVVPALCTGQRLIYVAVPACDQDSAAGIIILKNTQEEKKICTLYVSEQYRAQNIGTRLLQQAIAVLGTEKPLITVSDEHRAELEPLLQKFGFEIYERYAGYYRDSVTEYAYNRPIEPYNQRKIAGA